MVGRGDGNRMDLGMFVPSKSTHLHCLKRIRHQLVIHSSSFIDRNARKVVGNIVAGPPNIALASVGWVKIRQNPAWWVVLWWRSGVEEFSDACCDPAVFFEPLRQRDPSLMFCSFGGAEASLVVGFPAKSRNRMDLESYSP